MANRFGRNQRRKLREELATVTRDAGTALALERRNRSMQVAKLQEILARSIEVDVTAILHPDRRSIELRASCHAMSREPVYKANRLDQQAVIVQRDQAAMERLFDAISKDVAHHLSNAVAVYWGKK